MSIVTVDVTVCDGCQAREGGGAVHPMTEFVAHGDSLGHLCASCFLMVRRLLDPEQNAQVHKIFLMLLDAVVVVQLFPQEKKSGKAKK